MDFLFPFFRNFLFWEMTSLHFGCFEVGVVELAVLAVLVFVELFVGADLVGAVSGHHEDLIRDGGEVQLVGDDDNSLSLSLHHD